MKWKILFVTLSVTVTMADKASSEQLIVNSYGGPYEEIIRSRIIEPFEKEFNVKVIYDAVGSASQESAGRTDRTPCGLGTAARVVQTVPANK